MNGRALIQDRVGIAALGLLPLLLLAGLIALFTVTNAGLDLEAPAPIEELSIERVTLEPGTIHVNVRNTGPDELTLTLVNINESTWPATASPSNVIPRLGTATLTLHYPWVEGEAYEIAFITSNSIIFETSIPVAFATPEPSLGSALRFALIGLYVGVLPVGLGVLWLPVMRSASRRAMLFLIALTCGVLLVLGIDTFAEALERASAVPGPFQGVVLVFGATVLTAVLLAAIGARQGAGRREPSRAPWELAFLIALGIGLHNLGEGLAIGAAYSVGEIALGAFLVIGFIIQNTTEGVAIVVPVMRDRVRPARLVALVAVAGAPAIIGTLIGAFTYSPTFAALFLAVGAGAIFEVLREVGRMTLRESVQLQAPLVAFVGALAGALILYLTGVLVK